MSSSSSPYTRPWAVTDSVARTEAQEFQYSPLKPEPLRISSKTRPSSPQLVTRGIEGSSSRLSQSQRDGQYSATTPVHRTPGRTPAPSLAGLVSKFEILDAMNNVGSPARRTYSIATPSPEVSPPAERQDDLTQEHVGHTLVRKPSSGSISPLSTGSHLTQERETAILRGPRALNLASDSPKPPSTARE